MVGITGKFPNESDFCRHFVGDSLTKVELGIPNRRFGRYDLTKWVAVTRVCYPIFAWILSPSKPAECKKITPKLPSWEQEYIPF